MRLVLVSQILKKEWTTYSSVALGSTRISECFFRQKTVLPLTNELDLKDNPPLDIQLCTHPRTMHLSYPEAASSSSEEEHENRSCTCIADTEFTVRIPQPDGLKQ